MTNPALSLSKSSGGVYAPAPTIVRPSEPTSHLQRPVALITPDCNDEKNTLGTGPDLSFLTIQLPVSAGIAFADVPLPIPKSSKFIMLSNIGPQLANQNESLFMHFQPLNKTYNSPQITPVGNENWFPFCNASGGATAMTKIGLFYRFKKPLPSTIYFEVGVEGGATNRFITFIVGNDIEEIGQLMNSTS